MGTTKTEINKHFPSLFFVGVKALEEQGLKRLARKIKMIKAIAEFCSFLLPLLPVQELQQTLLLFPSFCVYAKKN
ncbi:MAG: hypothetical protein CW691_07925 [Candidatus Bathyarchaeum sp.]|nr:MAG: hypothetical protein CW691_07925 [Candidatus Bathyarchaeum sp.]